MTAKFIKYAFGSGGDKTAIPNLVQPDGSVSWQSGFGFDYQRQKTDPLAKNIERDKYNQALFDLSSGVQQYQQNAFPDYITAADNDGAAYAYREGDYVRYTDGFVYVSIAAANVALPTDATKWRRVFDRLPVGSAAAGSGNAVVVAGLGTPAATALAQLSIFAVKHSNPNTGAATLQVNGLVAKAIVRDTGLPLLGGEIAGAGYWGLYSYDATQDKFVLLNPSGASDVLPTGQCRLAKSGANILLSPYGGNRLVINGAICRVPSAGVSLAPAGLGVGTLYYVYAVDANGDGVVDTLEASVTGHSTDAATGVEIKTGDATRTLVGMVRPTAGPAFTDSVTQAFVSSYFNRRAKGLISVQVSVSGIGTVEVERTPLQRCEFLTWADGAVLAGTQGFCSDGAGSIILYSGVAIDGSRVSMQQGSTIGTANYNWPLSTAWPGTLAEGYHYSTMTATTSAGANGSILVQNWAQIQG